LNKKFFLLLLIILVLFSVQGCSLAKELSVWYLLTDNAAYLVVFPPSSDTVLIAKLQLSAIRAYREKLALQGIQSDDLGALQDLFALRGDHYLRGPAAAWQIVRAAVDVGLDEPDSSISIDELRIKTIIEQAQHLSKTISIDTLEQLAGPRTSSDDIVKAVQKYRKVNQYMFYDTRLFIDEALGSQELKQYLGHWLSHALDVVKTDKR